MPNCVAQPFPGQFEAQSSDDWGTLAGQIGSGVALVVGVIIALYRGFIGSWPAVRKNGKPEQTPEPIKQSVAVAVAKDSDAALDLLNGMITRLTDEHTRLTSDNSRLWDENQKLWRRNGELDERNADLERQMRALGVDVRNLNAEVLTLRALLVHHNIDPGRD